MKKVLLFLATFLLCQTTYGQENWLWPVKGHAAGQGIIYAPDSYIGKEHNFGYLFLTAAEGTEIVSPTDGTITDIGAFYFYDLNRCLGNRIDDENDTFDQLIKSMIEHDDSCIPKYITGSISISTSDGCKISIEGLTGNQQFKTGQKIKKGDLLGYMSYSYKEIEEPSISISTTKYGHTSDPMTPFGIKTTFIPAKEMKSIKEISQAQALEDFQIFTDAVEECYPALYHCFTPAQFDTLKNEMRQKITGNSTDTVISYSSFRKLILTCFSKINDSHIYLFPTLWENDIPEYQPAVFVGIINDTLRITRTTQKYKDLFGKVVARINGYDADSVRAISMYRIYQYDADVQSYIDFKFTVNGLSPVYNKQEDRPAYDSNLEFPDGTSKYVPRIKYSQARYNHNFDFFDFNYYGQKGYDTKMLNDSTAYLGLSQFQYNMVQMEEMKAFVDSASKAGIPNMIVDVRNNPGGNDDILREVWSWFAQDTLRLNGCRRINKQGDYKSFDYSDNYTGFGKGDIFEEYVKVEGIEGFCDTTFNSVYYPDTTVNYRGKLYMLTNELSISAATLLPALAVRSHRGVTVGRETCSAYHFINALKFVNIILPNSQVRFRLPLVEDVFDTQINDRVPYGRGVLPDYEVPLSFEEVTGTDNDIILDKALELIATSQYINYPDPFIVELGTKPTANGIWKYIFLGAVFIAVIAFLTYILRNKKRSFR